MFGPHGLRDRLLIIIIVCWALKLFSNYEGPYIHHDVDVPDCRLRLKKVESTAYSRDSRFVV